VSFDKLPEEIEVERYKLFLKDSFHVSLVCVGKIIEKNNINIKETDFLEKVITDFCNFTKENKVDLIRYRDEFKFVEEDEKRSMVVMCDISNLDKFFDFINKKYDLNLEYPPTHITLYTLQPNVGIFFTDSEDVKNLTRPIENPGVTLNK